MRTDGSPETATNAAPLRHWWRGSLRRRYTLTFVLVVSLPLVAYGLVSTSLTYRQQRDALAAVQLAQAEASAARILQFLHEVELQLTWLTGLPWSDGIAPQRRLDALRVLRQAPAITDIVLVDGQGRERVTESRHELSQLDTLASRSASPAFAGARANRVYFGDVSFRKGSEPFMTVAVAGSSASDGVAIAEVSLKRIWDVVAPIRIGTDGIAYVMDRSGRLIAHPDINLVLRNTDLSLMLGAFESARQEGGAPQVLRMIGTRGQVVLASSTVIAPVGWRVVVEQPKDEADEPVRAAMRSALWMAVASLLLALAAATWSAWRMATPLRALARGAAKIGAGELGHRIDLRTGDELQALGDRFNAMADELQSSYGTLERKVDERTRELSEANRARSRLIAATSHDLRQPLHALNLLVAQLGAENEPRERTRLASRVEAALASINALFSGLLDVSKLDAGVMHAEPMAFPLQQVLDRVDVASAPTARARNLELRIRLSTAWVVSDPVLLERIVVNLVGNALRYTRAGAVLVGCRRRADAVRIEVWDTGIGIPDHEVAKIFEDFYQVPIPGAPRGEGLGLGLSIVSRLSHLLGHAVSVRSVPGRGSCFSVTVPQTSSRTPSSPATTVPAIVGLRDRSILIIDNDPLVLESTALLLRSWGCEVSALTRAPQDQIAIGNVPDLMIVDMHLDAGEDGVSTVARLRCRFGHPVPALIMTGDVSQATRDQVAGAHLPMLEKPVSPLRMRTVLTRLLLQRD